jgi:FAD/FMN-containing dehydrogenase
LDALSTWRDDYRSWGRTLNARHHIFRPGDIPALQRMLGAIEDEAVLAFGCGRSYGDVALNPGGALIDCSRLDRFIDFDPATGILECEAGVRLADILEIICKPEAHGSSWLLPVTPGTRFISVAGAIANDVHGKNHHGFGTFGRYLLAFDLLRGDGSYLTCSPTENQALFAATIGGLGLTGLILRARLQLRRVPGLAVESEQIRFDTLDDFFDLAAESDRDWEYTAAWIDSLATGKRIGRGIYARARHRAGASSALPASTPSFGMPVKSPFSLATPMTVRAFNALYWRKLGLKRRVSKVCGYASALYPLDAVDHWNRAYGPAGFFQFQSVVPSAAARSATAEMLRLTAASSEGSMISVLKVFGDLDSPGMLSFPMPGITLALDFPNRGAATCAHLAKLENIAIEAGGRIYPAKDSLMTATSFRRGFPRYETFLRHIDPRFSSGFARRVGLLEAAQTRPGT